MAVEARRQMLDNSSVLAWQAGGNLRAILVHQSIVQSYPTFTCGLRMRRRPSPPDCPMRPGVTADRVRQRPGAHRKRMCRLMPTITSDVLGGAIAGFDIRSHTPVLEYRKLSLASTEIRHLRGRPPTVHFIHRAGGIQRPSSPFHAMSGSTSTLWSDAIAEQKCRKSATSEFRILMIMLSVQWPRDNS